LNLIHTVTLRQAWLVPRLVTDRIWIGKPAWHRTRHPGLLSLSLPSVAGRYEYLAKAEE